MAGRRLTVVIERDEDGILISRVPALPGCHTQGRTLAEVQERTREAIELYLEELGESGESVADTEFVALHQVDVEVA